MCQFPQFFRRHNECYTSRMRKLDLVIVGGGAAGYAAAIYAGRYLLNTVLVQEEFGGLTSSAWIVENYPGFPKIDGFDLMEKMKVHAAGYTVPMEDRTVTKISKTSEHFRVEYAEGEPDEARSVILAIGAMHRKLGLPGEDKLVGKGLAYCATCDAPLYKGKRVAIVGGGDSSVKGANILALYAKEIWLIVRDKDFIAEPVNRKLLEENATKVPIHVLTETEVKTLNSVPLKSVTLSRPYKGSTELSLDGLFVEIGAEPRMELPKMLGLHLDPKGYVDVGEYGETNVPGVYAAGDITNASGSFRQVVTAAAQGALAATGAYRYLTAHDIACSWHAKVPKKP